MVEVEGDGEGAEGVGEDGAEVEEVAEVERAFLASNVESQVISQITVRNVCP